MYDRFKRLVLRFFRVPPEPNAPAGSPGSLHVFQAGENYYKYKLVLWGIRQMFAVVVAVMFVTFMSGGIDQAITRAKTEVDKKAAESASDDVKRRKVERVFRQIRRGRTIFEVVEVGGLVFLAVQLPFTFAMVRLDYEMRWYITTDRSLRIREGLASVREMTLTFANVQNVTIRQGPLQRLLGLADVVVETAGGGAPRGPHGQQAGNSLHEGALRGVDNATEIRDLILARLRKLKDAGLGDPDEKHLHHGPEPVTPHADDAIAAARAVLEEARGLRRALEARA